MIVYEKLLEVSGKLKAPKSQFNKFGGYKYRNCEDILEAVKPLCKEVNAVVLLSDDVVMVGERYYVKASAIFVDAESGDRITVTAYAREEDTKKGMDGSQITGASSSYARKYALNGLFDIDDTKDSDSTNTCGKAELMELKDALVIEYEGKTLEEIVKTDKELANKLLAEGEDNIKEALNVILKAMKARAKK